MKEENEKTGRPQKDVVKSDGPLVVKELPPLIDSLYPRIAIGDLVDIVQVFAPTVTDHEILQLQMEMYRLQDTFAPPDSTFTAISSKDLVKGLEATAEREAQGEGIAVVHLDRYIGPTQTHPPFHRLNISRGKDDSIVARPGSKYTPSEQLDRLRESLLEANTSEILLIDDVLAYAKTLVPIIKTLQREFPDVRIRAAVALASSGGEWSGIEKVREGTGVEIEAQTVVKVSPKNKYSSGMSAPTSRDMTIFGGALDNSGASALSYPHIYPFAIPRPSFFNVDHRLQASVALLDFNERLIVFVEKATRRKLTIKDLLANGFGIPTTKIEAVKGQSDVPSQEMSLAYVLNAAKQLLARNTQAIEKEAEESLEKDEK